MKEYLLKPITADELGQALRRVAGQIAEERASTTDAIRDIQNNLTNLQ